MNKLRTARTRYKKHHNPQGQYYQNAPVEAIRDYYQNPSEQPKRCIALHCNERAKIVVTREVGTMQGVEQYYCPIHFEREVNSKLMGNRMIP